MSTYWVLPLPMSKTRGNLKTWLSSLVLSLWLAPTQAHEIALQLRVENSHTLVGELRYSDRNDSSGDYIRIANLTDSSYSDVALQTDANGQFRFGGIPLHEYAVTAMGQEGHSTTVNITLAVAPSPAEDGGIPIYLWLAGLLLLSLIPAHFAKGGP